MVEKRVSLVTGASSGIGRAIALRFGSKGMRVGLVARRKDRLAQVAAAIEKNGGEAPLPPRGVGGARGAGSLLAAGTQGWGRPRTPLNQAGDGGYAPSAHRQD